MRWALERDGVTVRTGVRALRARAGAGTDGAHVIELDDGSTAEGHAILLAVGREFPLDDLGLEHYGVDASRARTPYPRDGALRLADGLWVVGDPGGPELHTHQAHYQGELVVRMALGEDVVPDYRALPRATYTDPEAASVGLTLDQARAAGLDAFECVADFPKTAKGYAVEAETGHVTIVVDRATRELVGAAMACPDASAAIHECVLAIRARVPVDVLAETIHAFPSTSRILNGLFAEASRGSTRAPDRPGGDPPTAGSAARDDLPVEQDEPGPRVPQGAAGLDRLRERRRREHDEVGAVARQEPAAIVLAGADRPGRRRPPGARATGRAAFGGPSGGVPAGHDGAERVTAHAMPGHGSIGSTGASVPNGMTAPVARDRATRRPASPRARPTGGAPSPGRSGRGPAGRRRDPERGEARDVGRVEQLDVLDPGHERASRRRSGRARRARRGPPRRRSRGSGSRSRATRRASPAPAARPAG